MDNLDKKKDLFIPTLCLMFHLDAIQTAGPSHSPSCLLKDQERLDCLRQSYIACLNIIKEQQFTSMVSIMSHVMKKSVFGYLQPGKTQTGLLSYRN